MFNNVLMSKILEHFPKLQIKFKDQSIFMKFLGTLLFFNKEFMKTFTTTIGSTIYYPSQDFFNTRPVSSLVILLHELVHMNDAKKISKYLFSFLYLSPQILAPFSLLLLFFSWKLAIPLTILFLCPVPSYFRMLFEKRAYMASLYVMKKLADKNKYTINLVDQKDFFLTQFKKSFYYYMWPFNNLDKDFVEALNKINDGKRPFENEIFDILDDIVAVS